MSRAFVNEDQAAAQASQPVERRVSDQPNYVTATGLAQLQQRLAMLTALRSELQAQGVAAQNISHFNVPGAFEIPLLAKKLAASGRFDAIIACALVVNGGIYRHEFVSSAVIDGLMRVQLDSEIPVFSAVLTPRDFHEHGDHVEFFRAHFVKKGVEVAHACLAALDQLSQVQALGHARAA